MAPDIAVAAADALDTAYVKALEALAERAGDEEGKRSLVWLREGLQATLAPFAVGDAALRAYVGSYGPRRVTLEGGALFYQREGRPKFRMVPMADGLFVMPDADYFRVSFERDAKGRVVRLVGIYEDGRRDSNDRTGP